MINREKPLDLVGRLFGLKVSRESPYLKDRVNSFVRNELFKVDEQLIAHRTAKFMKPGQETRVWNAILLNAIFSDPRDVKKLFEDADFRKQSVDLVKELFRSRGSAMGIALQSQAVIGMTDILESGDLDHHRMPNPFSELPQVALGKNSGLLYALLAQAASLSAEDSLLHAYLSRDYLLAEKYADQLATDLPILVQLIQEVRFKADEAREFSKLLDFFDNR